MHFKGLSFLGLSSVKGNLKTCYSSSLDHFTINNNGSFKNPEAEPGHEDDVHKKHSDPLRLTNAFIKKKKRRETMKPKR